MSTTMCERDLEQKLVARLQELGIMALKYANAFRAGYPDRLCLCPGGYTFWVEVKSPGRRPRPLQLVRHLELEQLGYRVFVVDDAESLSAVLHHARTHCPTR